MVSYPGPPNDDYNNIDPKTYEGIFYQEQEDFGHFDLQIGGLEELENNAHTRGELVVDLKDIDVLSKFHAENDDDDEPGDELPPYYSRDSDSDSENENQHPNEESDDDRYLFLVSTCYYVFYSLVFIFWHASSLHYVFMLSVYILLCLDAYLFSLSQCSWLNNMSQGKESASGGPSPGATPIRRSPIISRGDMGFTLSPSPQ